MTHHDLFANAKQHPRFEALLKQRLIEESGRMSECAFSNGDEIIEDEYGEWKLECVGITPLPAIDLTTGEKAKTADPPYTALFLKYLDSEYGQGEQGSFPIRYCPMCGRKLFIKAEADE